MSAPAPVVVLRGHLGNLIRFRPEDKAEIDKARSALAEEKFINAVERALAAAPPLRAEVRDRVIGLLSTSAE